MGIILKTENLTKSYKGLNAVDNVSLTINQGDIYGFVGCNGAGKTTLIRMVTKMIMPTSGSFTMNISSGRGKLAAIVEGPAIYTNLSGMNNMKAQGMILGINDENIFRQCLQDVGLDPENKRKSKDYSLGMRQRLGIAMALLAEPEFLILDEPTNGLDPNGIIEIRELIIRLNKEKGITILISSHLLSELAKMATRFGIIDHGKLIKEITAEEINNLEKTYTYVVSDTTDIERIIKENFNTNAKILSPTVFTISQRIELSDMAVALSKENIKIITMNEKGEDFEQFFKDVTSYNGKESNNA